MIDPRLFDLLDQRSQPHNSWDGYRDIMRYLEGAMKRIPSVAQLTLWTDDDVERHFISEVTYVAALVFDLFPGEGPEELSSYLPSADEGHRQGSPY